MKILTGLMLLTLVVALAAFGVSLFKTGGTSIQIDGGDTSKVREIIQQAIKAELANLGATPGTDHYSSESFYEDIFARGASSTIGIGTTTNVIGSTNYGSLILDVTNATPTLASYATSTFPNASTDVNVFGDCYQGFVASTSQPYARYIGDTGGLLDADSDTIAFDGPYIIEYGATCQ